MTGSLTSFVFSGPDLHRKRVKGLLIRRLPVGVRRVEGTTQDERAGKLGVPDHRQWATEDLAKYARPRDIPRRPGPDDPPPVEHHDPAGVGQRQVEIVKDRDHGTTLPREPLGGAHHHLLMPDVERGGRLIEQYQRRLLGKYARQRDARLLTTGEGRKPPFREV